MKNDFEIIGDITVMIVNSPKYGRHEIAIDTDDLPLVSRANIWRVSRDNKNGSLYVIGRMRNSETGMVRDVKLHRLVLGVTDPKLHVDHISGQTLDNRRKNLRIVTARENGQNGRKRRNNTSGHVGVTWSKSSGKWAAQIYVGGKNLYLGYFSDIKDAIAARKQAESEYFQYKTELLESYDYVNSNVEWR